ncbi:MAG: amidohydrolase family protein [Clostridia bacterium]|nr:amidohydrolase family protein [Clostridia bacterium]
MKAIVNTNVILEDCILFDGVVLFENDRIVSVGKKSQIEIPKDAEIIDAEGLFTAPGLVDIHNHGSENNFFTDNPEECCAYFLKHGQTTVLPTFYQTYTAEEMIEGCKKLKEFSLSGNGRIIKGLYMEAPYMRSSGSNKASFKWGDEIHISRYKELVDNIADYVKVWAIDPARTNIEEFMNYVNKVKPNSVFSFGHSGATSEQCEKVVDLGVKLQTHHGDSGKPPKINQARHGAGCDEYTLCNPDMYAELICDQNGIHLSPYTIRSVIKSKGVEKIILITDSYPKTGDYKNDESKGVMWGPDLNYDPEGWLAGSHLTLDGACRNVMSYTPYGICNVVRMASLNPAKLIGIDKDYGSIKQGKVADLILVDNAFNVKKVFLQGEQVM